MNLLICAVVISAAFSGVNADTKTLRVSDSGPDIPSIALAQAQKDAKLVLAGAQMDLDLSVNKTATLIEIPSFLQFNTNHDTSFGVGANLIIPLLFPLNFSLAFNTNKNVSVALNAGGKNVTVEKPGWGWEAPPSPPGWEAPPSPGWEAPPSPGWEAPPSSSGWAVPTTPGWAAPSSTPGWVAPSSGWSPPVTTPGWEAPTTTMGWTPPPPPPTSGWGWKKEEDNQED